MILCPANALHFLFEQTQKRNNRFDTIGVKSLNRKLLFYDFSVEDLSVTNQSSRNRIIVIKNERFNGDNFLLKQPIVFNIENINLIRKEYLFYDKITTDQLHKYLPLHLGFDENNGILFRQWIKNSNNLDKYLQEVDQAEEQRIISHLGTCLADFHLNLVKRLDTVKIYGSLFETFPPSLLLMYKSEQKPFYEWTTSNQLKLYNSYLSIPENSSLVSALRNLATSWNKSVITIIHADIKPSNIIIENKQNIYIIDWEMAMSGDAAWDVASLLYYYVKRFFKHYQFVTSLATIKYQFQHFWFEYSSNNYLTNSDDFKNRVIGYTGVKIIDNYLQEIKGISSQSESFESLLELGKDLVINNYNRQNYFFQ